MVLPSLGGSIRCSAISIFAQIPLGGPRERAEPSLWGAIPTAIAAFHRVCEVALAPSGRYSQQVAGWPMAGLHPRVGCATLIKLR